MKLHANYLLVGLCLATLSIPMDVGAATVWNGPSITYTQPAPDPTQATNRDQLTASVSLTRALTSGMFNGVTESFYTHDVSPTNTAWAVGELSEYNTLTYTNWETAGGGNPVLNLPGQQLVVHLIPDDIYLSLKFTSLGGHGAGGFSYVRSTPSAAPPEMTIQLNGNLLDISWPTPGWRLQTQTNGLGAGIGTNWVAVPDSTSTNHVVVPIGRANGSVFYRLALP